MAIDSASLAAIFEAAVKEATENVQQNQTADNRAIVKAAVLAATAGQQKNRNLPPFDPKNIDTWIRRRNAPFDRLDITEPRLKFSHVDEKIPSNTDPIVNDFMCGSQTTERWSEFVEYL